MKLFDPTSTPRERTITLAPRVRDLRGLRVGLVENTKFNSDVILAKLGERLARQHGMTVSRMIRKRSPSHAVTEEAADELRTVLCPTVEKNACGLRMTDSIWWSGLKRNRTSRVSKSLIMNGLNWESISGACNSMC